MNMNIPFLPRWKKQFCKIILSVFLGGFYSAFLYGYEHVVIDQVIPSEAGRLEPIEIHGSHFGETKGNSQLSIGYSLAIIESWSDELIIALAHPETINMMLDTNIYLRINNDSTNTVNVPFNILEPRIDKVVPNPVYASQVITITGDHFGLNYDEYFAGSVIFNDSIVASEIVSWDITEINVKMPLIDITTEFETMPMRVNSSITYNGPEYNMTVTYIPSNDIIIQTVNPSGGYVGEIVAIEGIGFGEQQADQQVLFNGIEAEIIDYWSDTLIYAHIPPYAETGSIKILRQNEISNGKCFKVFLIPESYIFVDDDASGANNGQSWDHAFRDLQDALADAIVQKSYGVQSVNIWVAEGTYHPTQTNGDSSISFELISDVLLFGGFKGNETSLNQRDWESNRTILSGDLNENDQEEFNRDENSLRVVIGNDDAYLDGFTISGGNNNLFGGGIYIHESHNIRINNCLITNNISGYGALYIKRGSLKMTNCTFYKNKADGGGGLYNKHSAVDALRCNFIENDALYHGGGVYNSTSSNNIDTDRFNAVNCMFIKNSSGWDGGGIYNFGMHSVLVNCSFNGNTSEASAGSIYFLSGYGDPSNMVINCIFVNNSADIYDNIVGRIRPDSFNLSITNSIFYNNGNGDESSQIAFLNFFEEYIPEIELNNNIIQGWSGNLGGNNNTGDYPKFVDLDGVDDFVGTEDDNLRLQEGSPAINAGDNSVVPPDIYDIDNDGNTEEPVPDLDLQERITMGTVDIGPYEYKPPPPVSPTNFHVTSVSASQIELAWEHADINTVYKFDLGRVNIEGNGGNMSTLIEFERPGDTLSYIDDTDVEPNTEYGYYIIAQNSSGGSEVVSLDPYVTTLANEPPSIDILAPLSSVTYPWKNVVFSAIVSDDCTDMEDLYVKLTLDGNTVSVTKVPIPPSADYPNGSLSVTYSPFGLYNGLHTYAMNVKDTSGNETTKSLEFSIYVPLPPRPPGTEEPFAPVEREYQINPIAQ